MFSFATKMHGDFVTNQKMRVDTPPKMPLKSEEGQFASANLETLFSACRML